MPRPRFLKLEQSKQDAILDAARAEFSANGYVGASQNRIIEAAGVSKGAMYYYFDDKEDLYITVVEREFAGFAQVMALGPVDTPEQFWSGIEDMFTRSMAFLESEPERMALARSVARSLGSHEAPPALFALLKAMRAATEQVVTRGQQLGAVRQDLPRSLIVDIAMGCGEAMDVWFAEHYAELEPAEVPELNRKLLDIFKRIAAPEKDADV